jgi:hypothetical protein
MSVQSKDTGTVATLGTGSDWAIATLRTTGTALFHGGMLTEGDLAKNELRIADVLALQAIAARLPATTSAPKTQPDAGTERGPDWAIDTLRRTFTLRYLSGSATKLDVALLELRIAEFEALETLASRLSALPGLAEPQQPEAGGAYFGMAVETLISVTRAQIGAGEKTIADVAEAELAIAESRLRQQVAYGS